jgi:hypothetical protein
MLAMAIELRTRTYIAGVHIKLILALIQKVNPKCSAVVQKISGKLSRLAEFIEYGIVLVTYMVQYRKGVSDGI